MKREYSDDPSFVKKEASDVRVKPDPAVKPEPELYGPSKEFRTAVERLQHARASGPGGGNETTSDPRSDVRVKSEQGGQTVKHEVELYGPSKNFRNAVERLQQARSAAGQERLDDPGRAQTDVQHGMSQQHG